MTGPALCLIPGCRQLAIRTIQGYPVACAAHWAEFVAWYLIHYGEEPEDAD